jgi:hypothetical protein
MRQKFNIFGMTVTHQNLIRDKIKSGLIATIQFRVFCILTMKSKDIKIKTYKTIILPVALYGCETGSVTLREKFRLKGFYDGC